MIPIVLTKKQVRETRTILYEELASSSKDMSGHSSPPYRSKEVHTNIFLKPMPRVTLQEEPTTFAQRLYFVHDIITCFVNYLYIFLVPKSREA